MKRDLISIFDLSPDEIWQILSLAAKLKAEKKPNQSLNGKSLGLIFEKPSTRTTVSFAVAMYQLGGMPLVLNAQNLQRKRGETIKDTARTLSRYLDCMMIRAFKHGDVEEFSKWSGIPVINGLTDKEHPCQILGDLLTIIEKNSIKDPKRLKNLKVVFIGDGNNVANSWIAVSAILGINFVLAGPDGFGPEKNILKKSLDIAKNTGASIEVISDPVVASKDADVLYTDVWISMGSESEQNKRRNLFKRYQINSKLMANAKQDALIMHCLPANRGEEITDDAFESKNSVIFDQAENRLHIQKAILSFLVK